MLISRKKGQNLLTPNIAFIILNLVFFATMFLFISSQSSAAAVHEQTYAKQIALIVDSAKPGTNITLDISQVYQRAKENKYSGLPINIFPEKSIINVVLKKGRGYSFKYFNGAKITFNIENEILFIEVKK